MAFVFLADVGLLCDEAPVIRAMLRDTFNGTLCIRGSG
jgi:hypothetical protein